MATMTTGIIDPLLLASGFGGHDGPLAAAAMLADDY